MAEQSKRVAFLGLRELERLVRAMSLLRVDVNQRIERINEEVRRLDRQVRYGVAKDEEGPGG